MANIRSFPNNQDEYIGAEDVMRWLHGRTSGVFGAEGNAAVAPVLDAMAVTVSDGIGWIANENADGVVWWINDEAETGNKHRLSVDMADAVFTRIDRVVISWQTTNYVALPEVSILKGTPASNPVAPALTNNSVMRQISLASIRIPAGSTAITAAMITDERLDDSVCGLVVCGVRVDTSVMQAQFENFWNGNIAEFEAYMAKQKAAWENFLASLDDDILPVPAEGDAGKVVVVNPDNDGYILGDAQMKIPVTSAVPADSDVWIDPDEETEQMEVRTLLWENENPSAPLFNAQRLEIPGIGNYEGIEIVYLSASDRTEVQTTGFIPFVEQRSVLMSVIFPGGLNASRTAVMVTNGVQITTCEAYPISQSQFVSDYACVPLKIYGINSGSIPCDSGATKPLVLYAVRRNKTPEMYLNDPTYGDAALKAILEGRQILVRTPGKYQINDDAASYEQQHTALFSPVLTYHLPNYENEYLYLFYLRDEKQTVDLSAAGMGIIEVPLYGELKMKLSTKYMECPLEHMTAEEYGDLINTM